MGEGAYEDCTLMFVPDGEADPDAQGLYVKLHEVIAILRYEALVADREGRECARDYLDAVAEGFAEQAVSVMEEVEGRGLT